MVERIGLYSFCGDVQYGTNIGHAYLKNGSISFPKETVSAVRDNTLQEISLVDDRVTLSPTKPFGYGLEISYESQVKEFYEEYKSNAPDRDVYYGGEFPEAIKKVPMYLLKGCLGYDDNLGDKEIELTVGYRDSVYLGEVVRNFYIINMNSDKWIYRNIPYIDFIQEQKDRGRYFEMHLKDEPYAKILSGSKKFELRLYDEKRKNLKVGDVIRFDRLSSDDKDKCFYTKVKKIKRYDSFSELYDASKTKEDSISMYRCGSPRNITKESFLKRMETYYSFEKQQEYGVVAIQLEVIYSPETESNIKTALEKANQRRSITFSLDFATWDSFSGEYFKAICLAEVAHRSIKRKMSDIDFICHPIEVASIVHDILYSGDYPIMQIYNRVVAAAALHDVVEDTSYTLKDIDEIFGESICELVAEETENKRRKERPENTWRIRKEEFLEKLSKAPDFA